MAVEHYLIPNDGGEPVKFDDFKQDEQGGIVSGPESHYPLRNVIHTWQTDHDNGHSNSLQVIFADNGIIAVGVDEEDIEERVRLSNLLNAASTIGTGLTISDKAKNQIRTFNDQIEAQETQDLSMA